MGGGPKRAADPKRAIQKRAVQKRAVQNGRSKTGDPKRAVEKNLGTSKKTFMPTADHVHTGTWAHYTFPQSEISSCNSMVKSNKCPGFTIINVTTLYSLFDFHI